MPRETIAFAATLMQSCVTLDKGIELLLKRNVRHRLITILLLFLIFALYLFAQDTTTPKIEWSEGEHDHPAEIQIPAELRPHIPSACHLRAVLKDGGTRRGETILLYDDGDESFPEVHLHALRDIQNVSIFDGRIGGAAALAKLQVQPNRQVLAFAYHVGFDSSDTTFAIFAPNEGKYQKLFETKTFAGQLRVIETSPLTFEVWSADWVLERKDPSESCVWCPHRYRIRTYRFENGAFKFIKERTTAKPLSPGDISEHPFMFPNSKSTK